LLYILLPHPPSAPLLPYATLFRSLASTLAPRRSADRRFRISRRRDGARLGMRLRRWCFSSSHTADRAAERTHGTRPASGKRLGRDRKSTRLNSSHVSISYAVFCVK